VAAQKLYADYGFEAVGLRRGYYQPSNTDALVMLREQASGDLSMLREQASGDLSMLREETT
jgi:hypothetical protein